MSHSRREGGLLRRLFSEKRRHLGPRDQEGRVRRKEGQEVGYANRSCQEEGSVCLGPQAKSGHSGIVPQLQQCRGQQ